MKKNNAIMLTAVLLTLAVVLTGCAGMAANGMGATPTATAFERPKLVVVMTIDGLPYEQTVKYIDQLGEGGFKRLLQNGAWFANAHYGHATTYTAVGHATILTGAYPYKHGLVANDWFSKETMSRVYCVEDPDAQFLDEPTKKHAGTSPRNLKVSTVGDELRIATGMKSKVVSISVKDRGAFLTGGKLGTGYIYSTRSGRFITSTYFMKDYPAWVKAFHARKLQDQYFGKEWTLLLPEAAYARSAKDNRPYHTNYKKLGIKFPHKVTGGLDKPGPSYYGAMVWTPFGNDYVLEFVKAAVQGENLGRNPAGVPDILAVSFSSQDYVNHLFGPESRQSQDHFLRLDRTVANFLTFLDGWVGSDNYTLVTTADHGFMNIPEYMAELGYDSGRVDPEKMLTEVNAHLGAKYGDGKYALTWWNPTIYLDYELIKKKGLNPTEVENLAADFLIKYPGIAQVFTRTQLTNSQLPPTLLGKQVVRAWHRQLSGDLLLIQKPYWYLFGKPFLYGSTHGSAYAYDTHVPVIFMGRHFRAGKYSSPVGVVDIAPTLAHILNVRAPTGNEGRVLTEALR